jgi:hypothetical protein
MGGQDEANVCVALSGVPPLIDDQQWAPGPMLRVLDLGRPSTVAPWPKTYVSVSMLAHVREPHSRANSTPTSPRSADTVIGSARAG